MSLLTIYSDILLAGSYFASYVRVIDIVLAVVLVWGGYKGYKKGFVLEIISMVIFLVGIMLLFYGITKLFKFTQEESYLQESLKPTSFLFYIVAFIGLALLTNSIGKKLRSSVSYSIFGDLDSFVGLLLGVVKYAIFLSLIIWLCNRVGYQLPAEATADSQLYPLMKKFQPWLIETGGQLAPVVDKMFNQMQDVLQTYDSTKFVRPVFEVAPNQ